MVEAVKQEVEPITKRLDQLEIEVGDQRATLTESTKNASAAEAKCDLLQKKVDDLVKANAENINEYMNCFCPLTLSSSMAVGIV